MFFLFINYKGPIAQQQFLSLSREKKKLTGLYLKLRLDVHAHLPKFISFDSFKLLLLLLLGFSRCTKGVMTTTHPDSQSDIQSTLF